MLKVFDVAAYVLAQFGKKGELPVTTWKLQKLVYYCQAWNLVWDDKPLFSEPIQAWANGPVCPALYNEHRGQFKISSVDRGDAAKIKNGARKTVDAVLAHYGKMGAQYLSELTHSEEPWKRAREGLRPGERGSNVITLDSMAEFYGGL